MDIDTEQCTGCRICEIICSLEHDEKINPLRSRIRIESSWPEEEHIYICRQCEEPVCVKSCPENALSQSDNGVIKINYDKCTLCEACVEACPFDAIYVGKDQKLLVCDTCYGSYECVQWCPNDALSEAKETHD